MTLARGSSALGRRIWRATASPAWRVRRRPGRRASATGTAGDVAARHNPDVESTRHDAAPTCVARGDGCWFDGACCAGDFCTQHGQSYLVGTCLGKRADGGECQDDSWCRSGHCIDGMCRTL